MPAQKERRRSSKELREEILRRLTDSRFHDVYGSIVSGRKPGKDGWVVVSSPFREDRNPSFAVCLTSGRWKDFATDESGDVFDFVERDAGVQGFAGARDYLARRLGIQEIETPAADRPGRARGSRPRRAASSSENNQRNNPHAGGDVDEDQEDDDTAANPKGEESSDQPARGARVARRVTGVYRYTDAAGDHLYTKERLEPVSGSGRKSFRWRTEGRPYAERRGRQGPPLLYRLHQLHALTAGHGVFVVEGEKCVNTLVEQLRLPATCAADGASSWASIHVDDRRVPFIGKHVVILPDADKAGREHARVVAGDLARAAASITILELPDLADGEDVADWAPRYDSPAAARAALLELVAAAEPVPAGELAELEAEAEAAVAGGGGGGSGSGSTRGHGGGNLGRPDSLNDARLAASFCAYVGEDLRYVESSKDWIRWNGVHWEVVPVSDLYRRWADEELGRIVAIIETWDSENSVKARAIKAATESLGSSRKMECVLAFVRDDLEIEADTLDRETHLLVTPNAVVDLRTGEPVPPSREQYALRATAARWDPDATCPRWERFLSEIACDRADLVEYLHRVAGYFATGETSGRCFFVLHGSGRNGKSIFVNRIRGLLGTMAARSQNETFIRQRFGRSGPQNDLARLAGRRLVYMAEIPEGDRLDEARVKEITGNEPISARFLKCEHFEFTPRFKLVIATNHKPEIRESGPAIWERMRAVPFDAYFPKGSPEDDPELEDTLCDESAGILRWVVAGAARWYQNGLTEPECVVASTEEYREEMDPIGEWLREYCEVALEHRDENRLSPYCTLSGSLYKSYSAWCEEQKQRPHGRVSFGKRLSNHGLRNWRTHGRNYWLGVRVLGPGELPLPFDERVSDASDTQNASDTRSDTRINGQDTKTYDDRVSDGADESTVALRATEKERDADADADAHTRTRWTSTMHPSAPSDTRASQAEKIKEVNRVSDGENQSAPSAPSDTRLASQPSPPVFTPIATDSRALAELERRLVAEAGPRPADLPDPLTSPTWPPDFPPHPGDPGSFLVFPNDPERRHWAWARLSAPQGWKPKTRPAGGDA